ncbi:hypothetical protein ACKLNO_01630 [Neisseriaceae bacterium B1]
MCNSYLIDDFLENLKRDSVFVQNMRGSFDKINKRCDDNSECFV